MIKSKTVMTAEGGKRSSGKLEILSGKFDHHTFHTFDVAVRVMSAYELGDYSVVVVEETKNGGVLVNPSIRITAGDTRGKEWNLDVLRGVVSMASQQAHRTAKLRSPKFYTNFELEVKKIAVQLRSGELSTDSFPKSTVLKRRRKSPAKS